jgi:hypothetical protein
MCKENVGSFLGVAESDGATNSTIGPGDEGDPALETSVSGVRGFAVVGGRF